MGIRDTMQRDDFPTIDGIVQVWYLDPTLEGADVAGISDTDTTKPKPKVEASFSTGTMIAFAALGLFVFAAIVLGAFRIRRNGNDGVTAFDQSTITGSAMTTTNDSYATKQSAGFSAILPNSYTLDNARGMSAIPEGSDDSESRFNSTG